MVDQFERQHARSGSLPPRPQAECTETAVTTRTRVTETLASSRGDTVRRSRTGADVSFLTAAGVLDSGTMCRVIAIVALAGLLLSPVTGGAAAGCCATPGCCKSGTCPRKVPRADAPSQPRESAHCHPANGTSAPAPESRCAASAKCSGHAETLRLAPQTRGVLPPMAAVLFMPGVYGGHVPGPDAPLATGFIPLPFEPPRPTA